MAQQTKTATVGARYPTTEPNTIEGVDNRPRQQTQQPQPEVSKGQVAVIPPPRMMPPPSDVLKTYDIDDQGWRTLVETTFPAAKTAHAVVMALDYCKRRKLDVFKHPVHIVPVWNSTAGKEGKGAYVETIWPGISEIRTTAARTKEFAGMDVPSFGPNITRTFKAKVKKWENGQSYWQDEEATVTFPEWCQITVYRLLGGNRCPFPGPAVYWLETYARRGRFSEVPNEMWEKRARGQIEKCAEAAALRRAFPEEVGTDYAIDEIGAFHTHEAKDITAEGEASVDTPPEPKRSDYKEPASSAAPPHGSGHSPVKDASAGQADTPPPSAGGSDRKATGTAGVAPSEAAAMPEHDPETGEIKETEKSGTLDKSQLTDVEDLNETQPEPTVFEQFKRIGDFFMFSDAYLEDPARTEAEVIAWGAFYKNYLLEKEQHGNKAIAAAVKDTRGLYDAALKRASNAALKG